MSRWIRIEDHERRLLARVRTEGEIDFGRKQIEGLERVEIFPEARPDQSRPRALSLFAVSRSSKLRWNGDGATTGDGTLRLPVGFELNLDFRVRSPLASRTGLLRLRFSLRSGAGDLLRAARVRLDDVVMAENQDLIQVFGSVVVEVRATDSSITTPRLAPRLLDLDHWVTGFPRGEHLWRHRFVERGGGEAGSDWALRSRYLCDPASGFPPRRGWWSGDNPTSTLVDLDLAIHGGDAGRDFDVEAVSVPPGKGDATAEFEVEVSWVASASPDSGIGTPLDLWNRRMVEPYHQSLHTSRARQPASVVPTLRLADSREAGEWRLRFALRDARPTDRDLEDEHLTLRPTSVVLDPSMVLTQPSPTRNERLGPEVEARLDSLLDHDGCPIRRRVRLGRDEVGSGGDSGLIWRAAIADLGTAAAGTGQGAEQACRVGALDLYFSIDNSTEGRFPGFLEGVLWRSRDVPGRCGLGPAPAQTDVPFLKARLGWNLDAFGPGGQDAVVTDRDAAERPRSLIIPWSHTQSRTVTGDLLLHCVEESTPNRDQSLALRLEDLGTTVVNADADADAGADAEAGAEDTTTLEYVVLDPAPFLIGRVSSEFVTGRLGEIGNWSGGDVFGGSWELAGTEPFRLVLPPQGVGEEALKDYELQKALEGRRLPYRFGPPASAELSRTPFDQSFSEAPWNLRRLFGFPGQRLPGTELLALHWELLYGLSSSVEAPDLLLAELGARLGHPVRRLPVAEDRWVAGFDPPDAVVKRYQSYFDALEGQMGLLATRLAFLELWHRHRGDRPLELSEGVSFRFRSSRRTAYPLRPGPIDPAAPWLGGLRGGADWGFESLNIYEAVLEANGSSSGELSRAALTSLGGFGFQRAGFAHDTSKILSNTFLGKTFFYSLERIGRVGVLWNRAKHVIIYERSAAASRQFPDAEERFRGRVALRKVREFVEILQPERSYPDTAPSGQSTTEELERRRGFVLSSRFPQPILPVTSAWARDIEGGWVVPLYQPGFDAVVYPEPEIYLALDPLEDEDEKIVWGRLTDPEKLLFYTSTPATTDQTDLWVPASGVDFSLESPPAPPDPDVVPAIDPARPDGNLPDAPPVEPGYEAFTWHVDTGGRRVNLATARRQQGTEALIESVTMLRRTGVAIDAPNDGFRRATGTVRGMLAGAVPRVGRGVQDLRSALSHRDPRRRVEGARAVIEAEVKSLEEEAQDLAAAVETARMEYPRPDDEPQVAPVPEDLVGSYLHQLQTDLQNAWDQARLDLETEFEALVREALADALKDALSNPDRVSLRLQTLAGELLIRAERRMATAEVAFAEAARQLQRAVQVFDLQCPELVAELLREGDRLMVSILDARDRRDAARWVTTALRTLRGLESRLALLRRGLGPVAPQALFAVQRELSKAITRLLDARDALEGDEDDLRRFVAENLEPTIHRLVVTLEASCERLRDSIGGLDLESIGIELKRRLGKLRSAVQRWIDDIDPSGNLEAQLDDLNAAIRNELLGMSGFFDSAREHLSRIERDLKELIGDPAYLADAWRERGTELARRWSALISSFDGGWEELLDVDEVRREVDSLLGSAAALLQEINDVVGSTISDALHRLPVPDLDGLRDPGLWLARAFGESPVAETLRLNRDRIGYYLGQLSDQIDLTPVTALFNRVGRELEQLDLKTLGIRMPTVRLGDRFEPALNELKKIDLGDLLPDFAGIDLDKLLEGVGIPTGAEDGVDITHGFDPRQRRAWAQAKIRAPFDRVELLQLGPVIVRLIEGEFLADARLEINADGATQREVKAELRADWQLEISGFAVLVFAESSLHFDNDGRLRFETAPQKIRMHQVLNFITGLLAAYRGPEGSGLSFELVREGGGLPIGGRAVLSVLLPPLQTGAFSMSNLALRAQLEVAAPPSGFYIAAGGSLASRERPFNLSIMCLGGGGWFTVLAVYKPFQPGGRQLTGWLSVGISVGASLPFDVGVAAGGVYFLISVGVEGSLAERSGGLAILLRVAVWGEVVILGIVSIHILLALEAEYQGATGSLMCRGILRAKVKLGWMWEISVRKTVTYRLAGSGRSGSESQASSLISSVGASSVGAALTDVTAPLDVRRLAEYAGDQYLMTFAA